MAFSITLFPDPVEPAINRWGIVSRGPTLILPFISFPSAIVIFDEASRNSVDSQNGAQADHFALRIGNFDPNCRLPRKPLDENRFRLKAKTQVFIECS